MIKPAGTYRGAALYEIVTEETGGETLRSKIIAKAVLPDRNMEIDLSEEGKNREAALIKIKKSIDKQLGKLYLKEFDSDNL